MKLNLNDAPIADRDFTSGGEPIPDETEVHVVMHLVVGDDLNSDRLLTISKNRESKSLKAIMVVTDGPYKKRQWFEYFYLIGQSEEAFEISRTKLRSIVDAVLGLNPHDQSPAAQKKRDFDLKALNGVEFDCVVGIEPGKGEYKDSPQNKIKRILNDASPVTPNGKAVVSDKPKPGAGSDKRKAAFA